MEFGSAQAQSAFWEKRWSAAEHALFRAYAARFDPAPDQITEYLAARGVQSVCDAGCGCGAYALKLARLGFSVSGFDISADAAVFAGALLAENGCASGAFRVSDILSLPCPDGCFDAVVARDVLDHMPLADAVRALRELLRVTRRGGAAVLTLDRSDAEYEAEPHIVSPDGDYVYTGGKWAGMVFHPYTTAALEALTQGLPYHILDAAGGFTVAVEKGSTQ